MRKQIDLSNSVIKELKHLSVLDGRKLKPYIEKTLTDIAQKSIAFKETGLPKFKK